MIRVDDDRTARLGGVGFTVHNHHQIFPVHQVCGDRTADNRRGIGGGLGGNCRRGGRHTGIDVQHKPVRFRVVTGFVGDAHNVGVVAIAQAIVLEGPAGAAVHGHLTEQNAVAIELHDFAVVRGAVQRTVDQRRGIIRRHRRAVSALTLAFTVGVAHHATHGGWRRGIHRHHLRRGGANVARLVDNSYLVGVIPVRQIAGIGVAPALVRHRGVNPRIAAVEADLHPLVARQRAAQRTVDGQRGVHGDEITAGLPGILADAVDGDAVLRRLGIHRHRLRGGGPDVTRLVNNPHLVVVATVGQGTRIVIAPLRAAHGGVDPGSAAIHAHLNVLTRPQLRTERAVQGVRGRTGQEVVVVEAGIDGDVIHAHRNRRIRGDRIDGHLLMGAGAYVTGGIHHANVVVIGLVTQRATVHVVPAVAGDVNVLPGHAAVDADLRVFPVGQRCAERAVQRQGRIVSDKVAAAQTGIVTDAVDGDRFAGVRCSRINGHHLAGGGADVPRIVNDAQLVVVIPVYQRTAIHIRPAQTADADVGPGQAAVEANLCMVTAAQRRAQRPFQADLRVAGDKVAAGQTSILGDGINRDRRGRRRGQINHHVLAIRCPHVARVIDNTYLVLVRTVGQGAAVGIAPGCAGHAQITPRGPTVQADLRLLVVAELRGQRTVDDHLTVTGDEISRAQTGVVLQGINADPHRRRGEIHGDGVVVAGAVADGVADLRVNHVRTAVRQRGHICAAERIAPAAVILHGRRIGFTVQRNGHRLARRGVGGAADSQRRAVLGGVDDIVLRKGVNGDGWDIAVQRHVVRCAARVARLIAHRSRNGVIPVAQAEEITARHEDRPRTVCRDGRLITVPVEGDDHRLALFRRGGAANGLARQLFRVVDDIVIGHGADGHGWRNGVYR